MCIEVVAWRCLRQEGSFKNMQGCFKSMKGSLKSMRGFFKSMQGSFESVHGSFNSMQSSCEGVTGSFVCIWVVAGRHSRKLLTRLVRVLHYGWLTKVLSDWACGAAALHCRRNALLAQRGEGLRCARLVVAMRGWREALERWRGGVRVWGG